MGRQSTGGQLPTPRPAPTPGPLLQELRDMSAPLAAPILTTEKLSVTFGGLKALDDFDFLVIAGPARRPDRTQRRREDHLHRRPHRLRALDRHGLLRRSRTSTAGRPTVAPGPAWSGRGSRLELFDDLTVAENLLVGSRDRRVVHGAHRPRRPESTSGARRRRAARARSDLTSSPTMPSELSHGQRKLVGVARALLAAPKVVLMDEPAAGPRPHESAELGRHLRSVVDRGTAILLIDHDMGLVLSVCDYVYVLDSGR